MRNDQSESGKVRLRGRNEKALIRRVFLRVFCGQAMRLHRLSVLGLMRVASPPVVLRHLPFLTCLCIEYVPKAHFFEREGFYGHAN